MGSYNCTLAETRLLPFMFASIVLVFWETWHSKCDQKCRKRRYIQVSVHLKSFSGDRRKSCYSRLDRMSWIRWKQTLEIIFLRTFIVNETHFLKKNKILLWWFRSISWDVKDDCLQLCSILHWLCQVHKQEEVYPVSWQTLQWKLFESLSDISDILLYNQIL